MTIWWSEERIEATVKQAYIEKELGSKKHVDTLHKVLAFGDGLTDDTYLDWILERSPRIFLILNQIGVPDRIFELIDKSFADDDLPLTQDALWELNLFGTKSETLDKKFYREQFNFLIQEIDAGGHTEYGAWDVVPLDPLPKRPGLAANQSNDRVQIKKSIYTRKRIAVSDLDGIDDVHFVLHLKNLTSIQHSHLVTVWASYAQDEMHYILLTPSLELTLKTFLDEPPKAFKALEKHERRNILLTWTHCLTSALAYLHEQGFAHLSVRPSSILVDDKNSVFLGNYNALKSFDVDDQVGAYNSELYEHSPPENWLRKPQLHETAPLKTVLPGGGRTARKIPKAAPLNPKKQLILPQAPLSLTRTKSKSVSSGSGSSSNTKPRNAIITTIAPVHPEGSVSTSSTHQKRTFTADVFSHTTILLLLLSQILQHSPKSFASYRSRLNRQAGRGNAPPDSSFHKNLSQVSKWTDMLAKEAGQREKKDVRFWGAVVEIVKLCHFGVRKEPKDRIDAKDLEQKIAGWVDWGLGRRRECSCRIKEEKRDQRRPSQATSSEAEPASQYRIPQMQGTRTKQFPFQAKQKIGFPRGTPSEMSVDLQIGDSQPIQASSIWGFADNLSPDEMMRPDSIVSGKASTIWGLDDVSEDSPRQSFVPNYGARSVVYPYTESAVSLSTSCAVGPGRSESRYQSSDNGSCGSTETEVQSQRSKNMDWPLPLGTLTLGR